MKQVTRRSSRLQQKPQVLESTTQAQVHEPIQDDGDFENGASDVEDEEEKRKTTRKKHKTRHQVDSTNALEAPVTVGKKQEPSPFRNVRGRRGFLQYMNDMPLDLLYEIFGELEPIDLLYLSWSCKCLRVIVMDRQAKFLWVKAYNTLKNKPPPCPQDLNYAQYTRFLFVNRCMACQVSTGIGAYCYSWGLRFKGCKKCLHKRFVSGKHIDMAEAKMYNHCVRTSDDQTYYLNRLSDYNLQIKLRDDLEFRTSFKEDFQLKQQGESHYQQWRRRFASNRDEDIYQRCENRRQAIFKKLSEIGWERDNVEKYAEHTEFGIDHLPTFQRSSKLTQGEWRKIFPAIVSALEEGKLNWQRKRIRSNGWIFATTFKQWYTNLISESPDEYFRPVPFDFLIHEPFLSRVLNYQEVATFPLDEKTASTFIVLHKECLRKRNQVLFDLLPDDIKQQAGKLDDPNQVLHLASIWFLRGSTTIREYTSVLYEVVTPHQLDETHEIWKYRKDLENTGYRDSTPQISFHYKAHGLAKHLIQATGNDPNTITRKAMDSLNIKFLCNSCIHSLEYSWSNAVCHGIDTHTWDVHGIEFPEWHKFFRLKTLEEPLVDVDSKR